MKVLVTGGAGYIGSHTAKALAQVGIEPIVFDNLSTGHRWAVKWGPLVIANLQDRAALDRAIRIHGVVAAIHFAADAYVGESVEKPRKYFNNNVVGTLALLDALLDAGVNVFIFSSSCAVYGIPSILPIPEGHPTLPVNPYGESKLFVERALDWYGRAYDLRWAALRYFNAAGADPSGELGEDHHPETHLIPSICRAALDDSRTIPIFGTDYPTPDGTCVRDYIHVSDLADAHVKTLYQLIDGRKHLTLNLGTGHGFSVKTLVAELERHAGKSLRISPHPHRPGDPPALVANSLQAQSTLEWHPTLSSKENIIATAWKWHRSHSFDHQDLAPHS